MNVIHTTKSAIYRSWDSCDKTTLVVAITEDGVSVHHFNTNFLNAESALIQLSQPEALGVAERIQRVLSGEAPQNDFDQPGAKLIVTRTTDGDPYREGVSIALDTGDWNRDFDFRMDNGYASSLANLLQSVQG
ncbi:hypothetical protein [Pseudomonas aeruginosa]|uniref:hypothetical protein n=1 Tax=Pseudomonas aeruginosa TaxID=287 RepID=UPI000EB5EB16|nr:hypothetical protein [Pseudomonas aeruginosa]